MGSTAEPLQLLFERLNFDIADRLGQSMDAGIQKSVQQCLPCFKTSQHEQFLVHLLRRKYFKSADLFELYCLRNIFSTGMYPEKRRMEIAQLYQKWNSHLEGSEDNDGNNENDDPVEAIPSNDQDCYPSADQVPSLADTHVLERENVRLRAHWTQLQQQREALATEVDKLQKATQWVTASAVLPLLQTTQSIETSVCPVIHRGHVSLREWRSDSRTLGARMDDLQNKRLREDDDHRAPVPPRTSRRKARPAAVFTLEERYQQDQEDVIVAGNLNVVTSMIAPPNHPN